MWCWRRYSSGVDAFRTSPVLAVGHYLEASASMTCGLRVAELTGRIASTTRACSRILNVVVRA